MSAVQKPVAIVTGGGTGIGAAVALRLNETGYRVGIAALEENDGLRVAEEINSGGGETFLVTGDLSDSRVRDQLVNGTQRAFGRIDVLVNSAAITGSDSVAEALHQPISDFARIVEVNLTMTFACSQSVAKVMRGQGGGSIVNISSVAGVAAQELAAGYCASKGGIDALTRSLALEWAAYGIRVNAVAPGDIETEASRHIVSDRSSREGTGEFTRKTPLGRRGRPAEIANVVAFLCSNEASFLTGEVVRVDGGFLCY